MSELVVKTFTIQEIWDACKRKVHKNKKKYNRKKNKKPSNFYE